MNDKKKKNKILDRYLNGHLFEKQLIYGSTSFALGVLFKLSTNHSLKKAVSIYNSKSSNNESSLNPVIFQNAESGLNVGLSYSF